jgi:sugar transferase (PEP-CTERM/EpsH1 system associated)
LKILWVKSGGLVPLDHGGKIRSYQVARVLAREHDVTLFTFYPPTLDDTHSELRSFFSRVICVPVATPKRNSAADYFSYLKNLVSNRPYSVSKYCQPHVASELRQHLMQESYDVILCDFLVTAGVIPWDLPGPKIFFTHNVEAQIWERQFHVARNPVWKAACYREYRMMDRMEHDYLRRADHVLVVSEVDRNAFASFVDPAKISVIPTGVDVDYFRPVPEMEQPNTLVFTGSMDWMPNEDGIFYFVERILPLVRNEIPESVLWVVGRSPSPRLLRLAERVPGVKVTGTVADIRSFIAKASVYVVPLLVGGGTRLKIFEAMAMSKAVISTSIGAEGLPVVAGRNILLADDPHEFARQAVALLRNSARRNELGRAARLLVEQNHSWNSVGTYLFNALKQVVKKGSDSSSGTNLLHSVRASEESNH